MGLNNSLAIAVGELQPKKYEPISWLARSFKETPVGLLLLLQQWPVEELTEAVIPASTYTLRRTTSLSKFPGFRKFSLANFCSSCEVANFRRVLLRGDSSGLTQRFADVRNRFAKLFVCIHLNREFCSHTGIEC